MKTPKPVKSVMDEWNSYHAHNRTEQYNRFALELLAAARKELEDNDMSATGLAKLDEIIKSLE